MKPGADVAVDAALVHALLRDQHPDLAGLPIRPVAEGWDNELYRLGEDLVARLPRRTSAAALIDREQRWLPWLAPQLPLSIPVPLRVGHPGCGYPWRWSITPWFRGENALVAAPHDWASAADVLGRFLRALHQPAPPDAPSNAWRAVSLDQRSDALEQHLRLAENIVQAARARTLWQRVLSAEPWRRAPVWIHADLHPGNVIVDDGCVTAIVDFGDLTSGDPAVDFAVMWMILPNAAWPAFIESAGGSSAVDEHTIMRARGWALAISLAILAAEGPETPLGALAARTAIRVVDDNDP